MYDWYEKFYKATASSNAYSEYCRLVFGIDFSQHGFSNKEEITQVINLAKIEPHYNILDLGCGNGKMVEYISDLTYANGYGIDYSIEAIAHANTRTKDKTDKLTFITGMIGDKLFEDNFFNIIFSIDTIYFTDSLENTINGLLEMLKPKGRIIILYGAFNFTDGEGLEANTTKLAKTLNKAEIEYKNIDCTKRLYKHMKLKRKIAEKLKPEFIKENNNFIYDNIIMESINEDMDFSEFKTKFARYIYIITK